MRNMAEWTVASDVLLEDAMRNGQLEGDIDNESHRSCE